MAEAPQTSQPRVSDDRIRNVRNWAASRIGEMSGAEVIVAACDEALAARAARETREVRCTCGQERLSVVPLTVQHRDGATYHRYDGPCGGASPTTREAS